MSRLFTAASNHRIHVGTTAALGGLSFTWGTLAFCCQFAGTSGSQQTFSFNSGSTTEWYLSGAVPEFFRSGVSSTASTSVVANTPVLLVATKATGTVAPRNHYYRFSTNVWVHENYGTNLADAAATTALTIGCEGDTASNPLGAEVWACAIWPSYVFSDLECERLTDGAWNRLNPAFYAQWDTSRDNGDMATTLGRMKVKQTARTGALRGVLPPPPGFRMSVIGHRR